MASACVNNASLTQEFPSYGCFNPRASFSDSRSSRSAVPEIPTTEEEVETVAGADDFEFRLEDPVGLLPADKLFSDGKLVTTKTEIVGKSIDVSEMEIASKAPRCSSRWRDLLGLKRFSQKQIPNPNPNPNPRSLKQFLNRSSRSSSSSSSSSSSDSPLINLPLLKDSDSESHSRMSLSSSSSSHEHEESLPRLSLDNHHHIANPFAPARSLNPNQPRMRLIKSREGRSPIRIETLSRGVSVDSPRLNSSGKIVFQSLERSSSSPSSFNGGTSGYRHRGMDNRSYSSNVRVTPVLNVPVCSIRIGQFFSSNTRVSSSSSHGGGITRGRNSTDRI
ncbi:hypothetical protein AALP_AA2G235800 [Arabis alpina]|uniref:Uncharacterized protein n=1 Tax=Arabis alpina TaxID=50452 RepID=A0A087HJI3_ARAAL|nr:hypothetical protein AALP_AA2G235800 [Arabis alpina]